MRDPVNKKRLDRKYYQDKKKAGICTLCGECPAENGLVHCPSCAEKGRAQALDLYVRKKNKSVCPRCKIPVNSTTYCASCVEKISASTNARRKQLISDGICTKCRNTTVTHGQLCQVCYDSQDREKARQKNRKYKRQLSMKVFDRYGWECVWCGEDFEPALELDHVHNDGKAHNRHRSSSSIKLDALNDPEDGNYQILCGNCNWRKHLERVRKKRGTGRHDKAQHKARAKLKHTILTAYDGFCVGCGEADTDVLVIDHVHNDGSEHRKKVPKDKLYVWLKQQGFPEGFQVLCRNCNRIKEKNGGRIPILRSA